MAAPNQRATAKAPEATSTRSIADFTAQVLLRNLGEKCLEIREVLQVNARDQLPKAPQNGAIDIRRLTYIYPLICRDTSDMNYHYTSAGRLFSATLAGAPVTVRDLMVSVPIYLAALENSFTDTSSFLACFNAREKELARGAISLSNTEIRLAARWKKAHTDADQDARKSLSAPKDKEFVLVLAAAQPFNLAEPLFISAESPFTAIV